MCGRTLVQFWLLANHNCTRIAGRAAAARRGAGKRERRRWGCYSGWATARQPA
jgi:hypothetical protein